MEESEPSPAHRIISDPTRRVRVRIEASIPLQYYGEIVELTESEDTCLKIGNDFYLPILGWFKRVGDTEWEDDLEEAEHRLFDNIIPAQISVDIDPA
jgi:hypothetical protein